MRAQDGTLWFPTQDGVAVIDPAEVAANPNPPTVVIESLRGSSNGATRTVSLSS